jgi:uncharacterized protein with FMN-binding domain
VKRILAWVISTAAALVLLFGYRTSLSGPMTTPVAQAGQSGSGTVTGPAVTTRWGPVQVAITLDGGRITAVTVPQYPDGNRKDEQINARALPILVQETLDAQSADIDTVSGATVTSEGYVESLQAALDQAGR